jgi:hypothetical protein
VLLLWRLWRAVEKAQPLPPAPQNLCKAVTFRDSIELTFDGTGWQFVMPQAPSELLYSARLARVFLAAQRAFGGL